MVLNNLKLNKIIKSIILGLVFAIISFAILRVIGGYKIETNLYINDKYLKEMNEDAKYMLSSIKYLDYLNGKSEFIDKIFDKTDEYTLSKNLLVEKPGEDSTLKLTFHAKNKEDAILFSKEYAKLANEYVLSWKTNYFTKMVNNLQNQYNELNSKTDIMKYRDAQADSTISKLVTYKQIQEDKNDIVTITNYKIKGRFNKKIIVLVFFVMGAFIPIAIDILKKEFNK